jgi:uncharacterized protein (TIGR03382 family)
MGVCVLFAALGVAAACDPYENKCAKVRACEDEGEDGYENIDDDYQAVCVAQHRALERVLRANEEPECDAMADAFRNLTGCEASLECDDIVEDDLDGECEDERDDWDDAVDDADGECQTGVAPACAAAPGPVLAPVLALLLILQGRRRRPGSVFPKFLRALI